MEWQKFYFEFKTLVLEGIGLNGQSGEFYLWVTPYILGTILWIFLINSLLRIPPISKWLDSINQELDKEFEETDLLLMTPVSARLVIYWVMFGFSTFFGLFALLSAFMFFSAAIEATLVQSEHFNNFKAFILLATLGVFTAWLGTISQKMSMQVIGIIRKTRTANHTLQP